MDLTSPPLQSPIADASGEIPQVTLHWSTWFSKLQFLVNASVQSGTTAQRPTQGLFPGRFYFDTSLGANGKPIFVKKGGSGWVTADGVDA